MKFIFHRENYYADWCKETGAVIGWHNTLSLSSTEHLPNHDSMIVVTEEQWKDPNFKKPFGLIVQNGKIVEGKPLVDAEALVKSRLSFAKKYCTEEYLLFGEDVPPNLIDYMKKLKDSVKTEKYYVPDAPEELRDYHGKVDFLKKKN